MATPKQIQMRSLILVEYQSGNDTEQAFNNICTKLRNVAVKPGLVKYWFKRFNNGDYSVFNTSSYFHSTTSAALYNDVYLKGIRSMLFQFNFLQMNSKMTVHDGRVAFSFGYTCYQQESLVMADLFHGKIKEFQNNNNILAKLTEQSNGSDRQLKMIDMEHFLVFFDELSLLVPFILDYKTWTLEAFDSIALGDSLKCGKLIVDQQDSHNFMIYNSNGAFLAGRFGELQIDLGEIAYSTMTNLEYVKLNGSTLSGLRNLHQDKIEDNMDLFEFNKTEGNTDMWEFNKIDWQALEPISKANISLELENGETFELHDDYKSQYYWSQSGLLYAPAKFDSKLTRIMSFDPESQNWMGTNVSFLGQLSGLFVDENEILTGYVVVNEHGFYQFPLRKPESLKNLAWKVMPQRFNSHGSIVLKRIVNNFLRDCDLRPLIPN